MSSALVTAVDTFFQTYPYAAAALTCGVKASSADWVAQKRSYRKRNEKERQKQQQMQQKQQLVDSLPSPPPPLSTDVKRNVAFLLYGALYQGMAQEFIYNHLYPVMFGTGVTVAIVLSKVLFDLLIQTTLVTLPIAYLTKAVIYKYSAQEALRRYWDDILNHGLLKKYFLLWGPVQCITFSVVPEHYRVAFIACVSFFWLIILSTIASRTSTSTAIPVQTSSKTKPDSAVEVELSSSLSSTSQPLMIETENDVESIDDDEDIPECEFADGLTCNVDG